MQPDRKKYQSCIQVRACFFVKAQVLHNGWTTTTQNTQTHTRKHQCETPNRGKDLNTGNRFADCYPSKVSARIQKKQSRATVRSATQCATFCGGFGRTEISSLLVKEAPHICLERFVLQRPTSTKPNLQELACERSSVEKSVKEINALSWRRVWFGPTQDGHGTRAHAR